MSYLEEFIETGLWSTLDLYDEKECQDNLDKHYCSDDINEDFKDAAQDFIDNFLVKAEKHFTDAELSSSPIGHDLWLTVEGHGAGFWDGDYENGDALTEIVKELQSYDSHWGELLNESIERN